MRRPAFPLAVLLLALPALAGETVETPFPGVTVTHRTLRSPRPLSLWIVRADLTSSGVSVETSPGSGTGPGAVRSRLVPSVAVDEGYAVCVNAGVFRPLALFEGETVRVDGPAVHGGVEFAPPKADPRAVLCVDRSGRLSIRRSPLGGDVVVR